MIEHTPDPTTLDKLIDEAMAEIAAEERAREEARQQERRDRMWREMEALRWQVEGLLPSHIRELLALDYSYDGTPDTSSGYAYATWEYCGATWRMRRTAADGEPCMYIDTTAWSTAPKTAKPGSHVLYDDDFARMFLHLLGEWRECVYPVRQSAQSSSTQDE